MSIDAKIVGLRIGILGYMLTLEDRTPNVPAGQSEFIVENPPDGLSDLLPFIGKEIWGGSSQLLIGDKVIANRVGYGTIRLVDDWKQILRDMRKNKSSK